MSNVAVFAVGLLVTLLVVGAVSLLIWGAVMDGREDDERRAENEHAGAGVATGAGTTHPPVRPRAAGNQRLRASARAVR